MPKKAQCWIDTQTMDAPRMDADAVAYFSMEIGLDPAIPTYSGGLGVLAGDTLRGAADLGVPLIGVTLLYHDGYFDQEIDDEGNQLEHPTSWDPTQHLELLPERVQVQVEGRPVTVGAWRYIIRGIFGDEVPVLFLDTQLEENDEAARQFTASLYGGDLHHRLCQEVILGQGGVEMLQALGFDHNLVYHMNEGHSALLALGLLQHQIAEKGIKKPTEEDIAEVRSQCVFTTHTPVPAGHDQFPWDIVNNVLGDGQAKMLRETGCCRDDKLNMTYMALRFSRHVNGVALRHGEISSGMFPEYPIDSITNGVHGASWTCEPMARVFDRHVPEWRQDNGYLRYALGIPLREIRAAHAEAREALLEEVHARTGRRLDENAFTIGFARRSTPYKRADLFFADLNRIKRIVNRSGPMQVLYAGKAHPRDGGGADIIRRILKAAEMLEGTIEVIYLENYDMALGKLMTSGVDLWLNTPRRPHEASGTSGMKAALNGVPSLSVMDGWWIEGHIEGVTGWAIGADGSNKPEDEQQEIASMYDKLETIILPMFYWRPNDYARVMRNAIAFNGSFFNTQRMVSQYLRSAYYTAQQADTEAPLDE